MTQKMYTTGNGSPMPYNLFKLVATWFFTMQDTKNKTTALTFDVVNDNSPITIGLDIGKYSATDNISHPHGQLK